MANIPNTKCAQCESPIYKPPSWIKENNFCNWSCYSEWRKGKTFWQGESIFVTCANCKKEFRKAPCFMKGQENHFCCRSCQDAYYANKLQLTCENCGKFFERNASAQQNSKRPFCCQACWYEWRSKNEGGETHYLFSQVPVECAGCGAPLMRTRSRVANNKAHFCNSACYGKWIAEAKTGENAFNWKGGDIDVTCAHCDAPLKRPRNAILRSEKHFCGIDCRAAWNSHNITGENHPNWKGGWDPYYGPNWKRQRQRARTRDGHTCQSCGITREEMGREPDVHHIIAFREFGYVYGENENYRKANALKNLITLCPSCHHRIEWGTLALPEEAP